MPERISEPLRRAVLRRSGEACEYCQMPQVLYPLPFQVDHVIAQQHGGKTGLDNLAYSCPRCNRNKGPNIASLDPDTGDLVRLFNPRKDVWSEHFQWRGPELVGVTATGRVTVMVLAVNTPSYVAVREALIEEGVFPPGADLIRDY